MFVELMAEPYLAGATAAVVAGLLLGAFWRLTNPDPIRQRPTLTAAPVLAQRATAQTAMTMAMKGGARHRVSTADNGPALLEIPLDVIPKDKSGRTPYDVVGPNAIKSVIDQFYTKICADPALEDFFAGVDMATLKRHQALFIGQLWGGPVTMPLAELSTKHQRLHISPEQYWKVAAHLMVTLTHNNVPDWICLFTMTRLYQARDLIITRHRQTDRGAK